MYNSVTGIEGTTVAATLTIAPTIMEDVTHIGMTRVTMITTLVDFTVMEIIFTINQGTMIFTGQDTGIPFTTTNLIMPVLSK